MSVWELSPALVISMVSFGSRIRRRIRAVDVYKRQAEGLTLTIHHNAFYNDKDISEDEVIRGLKEGDVINPADYAGKRTLLLT